MTAFQHGLIDLGDGGLLDRFYARAPLERRAYALDSLGRTLMGDTEFTEAMLMRLQQLWERRLAAVLESPGAIDELRGFAWWFASGKFDEAWSLQQLQRVMNAEGGLDPDHVVAERLASCNEEHLETALASLELLIDSPTRRWFVFGARDSIRTLLERGLVAGGQSETTARDIVNRLVARGHSEFQDLLES
jgi:hypothetical protein